MTADRPYLILSVHHVGFLILDSPKTARLATDYVWLIRETLHDLIAEGVTNTTLPATPKEAINSLRTYSTVADSYPGRDNLVRGHLILARMSANVHDITASPYK